MEWKEAINKSYQLASYQIEFSKRFEQWEYADKVFPVILQFSVTVEERNPIDFQIKEDTTQKYVTCDGSAWKVCLGYRDLKPSIQKFRSLSMRWKNHETTFNDQPGVR